MKLQSVLQSHVLGISLSFLLLPSCFAVDTKFWQQGDRSDFEKGTLTHLSLRSDGRLFLAPEFPEIFDSSTPYLWSLASDSKGNLYTAGGGTGNGSAKVFVIDPAGKSKTLAELEGLEVHALAVDSKDQVYAATAPDGKVYKIAQGAKPTVFYDPHQKYIWTMAFNSKGDLFIATGDQGEIHRVTREGKGSVFFKTEETHARSMAIDGQDNLIVGTEPSGLVFRVSSTGQGFVLYQASKREITAVGLGKDGSIWASAVGTKGVSSAPLAAAVSPNPLTITVGGAAGAPRATPPPTLSPTAPSVTGGTDLYRINPDGSPRKAWANSQDIVYAIGFDAAGLPLLGTGNRGKIYRVDSDSMSTVLLDAAPTQVTGFGKGHRGELYAVTGNIGKVFRVGPGMQKTGFFESEVLDAGSFAYWGRLSFRGTGNLAVSTRSGNLNHPETNWSPWTPLAADHNGPVCDSCSTGRAPSPSARFLQYKIDIAGSSAAPSPDVSYVEIAYLPKNVAPTVDVVETSPANYKFPAPSTSTSASTSLTLPAIGQHSHSTLSTSDSSQTLTYVKGMMGVRWSASDENGDTLSYKVEIRGLKETPWKLLKDNVKEKYWSWDGSAYPDGEYLVRVTASDAPSNPRNEALLGSLESDPFVIDNTPPRILGLTAGASGNKIDLRWKARDERSDIDHAEYSVNGGEWLFVQPVSKLSDSPEQDYRLEVERVGTGEQVIAVRVTDEFDNQTVEKVVVK